MPDVLVVRTSKTKYGRKTIFRSFSHTVQIRTGRPPWAKHWPSAVELKKTRTGFKWGVRLGVFVLAVQLSKASMTPRQGKKLLKCPKCGYCNSPDNYFRRIEEDL